MGDAGGRRDRLDVVCLLQRLQAVPEPDTAAEHDRDLYQVHVVDQPFGEEVAYHGGPAAETHVLASGRLAGPVKRLGGWGVQEVERGAALHLDRWPRPVGEHEDRRMERRVGAPHALVAGVVLPARRAELAGAHDLGADAGTVHRSERVVGAGTSAPAAAHLIPEPGGEHPLVQALACVTERGAGGLTRAGSEAIERDREVVNSYVRHLLLLCLTGRCTQESEPLLRS